MKVKKNEALCRHTSFRVGGPAKCYVVPETCEELQALVAFLHQENIPWRIIGNGSNLLVSDQGVDGVVIELGKAMEEVRVEGTLLMASAGTLLAKAAGAAADCALSGMEAFRGIPGTVGGACVMNAGAYGSEIKDVLEAVDVITSEGGFLHLPADALELSYRHSNLAERGYIVARAYFRLKQEVDNTEILARMKEYAEQRRDKQPLDKPSAGSTFKRPEGHFAGKLIQDAGLKGFRMGGACVSEKHCGFVVNDAGASAQEIYDLIQEVKRRVEADSGVMLEMEVKTWGSF